MSTKTILKNDNTFVYEDYVGGKAALRLRELAPSQHIRRTRTSDVKAVLVSPDWLKERLDGYAVTIAAIPASSETRVEDDYLGNNLSAMVDLVNGHEQTVALAKKVVSEGITYKDFKVFAIENTKTYYQDDSTVIADGAKGGSVKGYLMHKAQYETLAGAPIPGLYFGTGNGTALVELYHGFAVAETLTITLTSATAYTVTGSISGPLGVGVVGTVLETAIGRVLVSAGVTPFVAADSFVITSYVVVT